jgi:G1/S-specific cyclin PLC1
MVLLPDVPETALCQFIIQPVSRRIIFHLAERAMQVVVPIPYPFLSLAARRNQVPVPSLLHFVASVVKSSHVQVSTLMASLVYLRRLQSVLPPTARGSPCSAHRIFLTCLILATKYVNDICPKNKHWVRHSVVPCYKTFGFTVSEISAMERELLCLLEWDLRINLDDLCDEMRPLLSSNNQRELKLDSGSTFLTQVPRNPVLTVDRHQLMERRP